MTLAKLVLNNDADGSQFGSLLIRNDELSNVVFGFGKTQLRECIEFMSKKLAPEDVSRLCVETERSSMPDFHFHPPIVLNGYIAQILGAAINIFEIAKTAIFRPGSSWPLIDRTYAPSYLFSFAAKGEWKIPEPEALKLFNAMIMVPDQNLNYTAYAVYSHFGCDQFLVASDELTMTDKKQIRDLLETAILPQYSVHETQKIDGVMGCLITIAYLYQSQIDEVMAQFGKPPEPEKIALQ